MAMVTVDERYLIRFEVEPNQVDIIPFQYKKKNKETKEYEYDKDGNIVMGTMYSQKAYIYLGKQIIECKIALQEGQPPYSVGMHVLDPSASIKIDNFGGFEFGFDIVLVPYSEAKAK
ncbi:TPA: single-stranded DNA-binding protein [Salmonella enterica subsp. enterica serovar Birkenhead]